ncbi:hypothetical protein [Aphanothece sacrum]|nr:hypothetical protein [Aphanothece sacrum]
MSSSTPESVEKFIDFCEQHITGKETKEAQIFYWPLVARLMR